MSEPNVGTGKYLVDKGLIVKDSDKGLILETSAYGCNNETLYDMTSMTFIRMITKLLIKQVVVLDHYLFLIPI